MIQVLFQMPKEEKKGDALNSAPDTQGDGEKRGDLVQPQVPKRGGEVGCYKSSSRRPRGERKGVLSVQPQIPKGGEKVSLQP